MTVLDLWWAALPAERYWLEVSDRGSDLGVDLNAPTTNEQGQPFWSYDLLGEVGDGDLIVHYDRSARAIIAWSRAVGTAWPDDVVWAARGTSAREQNIRPHERPGLRVSLQGPYRLRRPLTLARIREMQPALASVRADRPYFPFELGSRETRPMQGYLFKLPLAFLELFPELHEIPRIGSATPQPLTPDAVTPVALPGQDERPEFVPRNEAVRSREARPWVRDPSEVDRALSTHARIERLVAEAASAEGWAARAYGRGDPIFDLLLERADGAPPRVVVEVKSLTATNEEKQLRLALGQVLRYRQLLRIESEVVAFVAVERPPSDSDWLDLCASVGVQLVWPSTVRAALAGLI